MNERIDRAPRVGEWVTNEANPGAVILVTEVGEPLFRGRIWWTEYQRWSEHLSTHPTDSVHGWQLVDPPTTRGWDDPLRAILDAWFNPGINPEYHRMWQDRLRAEWPTLARAIERAAATTDADRG